MRRKRSGVAVTDVIALILVVGSVLAIFYSIYYGETVRAELMQEGKEIYITARQWVFQPNRIVVKAGQPVTLVIYGADVLHGFQIEKLGIDKVVYPGQEIRITITFDKPGTYIFRCSRYCGEPYPGSGIGHWTMTGVIIVE